MQCTWYGRDCIGVLLEQVFIELGCDGHSGTIIGSPQRANDMSKADKLEGAGQMNTLVDQAQSAYVRRGACGKVSDLCKLVIQRLKILDCQLVNTASPKKKSAF